MIKRPYQVTPPLNVTSARNIWWRLAMIALCFFIAACQTVPNQKTSKATGEIPLYELAVQAETRFDFQTAAQYYQQNLETNPTDRATIIGLARSLRYVGLAGEADRVMNVHSTLFPEDIDYQLEFAKASLSAGLTKKAIGIAETAQSLNPDDWRPYSVLGIANDILERYGAAQTLYKQALALAPGNPDVLNNLGMSLAQQGKIQQAVDAFEQAAIRDRKNPQIRQNLALMYAIQGNMSEARRLSEMSLPESQVDSNLSFYSRFGAFKQNGRSGTDRSKGQR